MHEILKEHGFLEFEVNPLMARELEESGLKRTERLPEVAALLEPLRSVHFETFLHCLRVGEVSARVLQRVTSTDSYLGQEDTNNTTAFISGVLHDIGKEFLAVRELMDAERSLSLDERRIVDMHVVYSELLIDEALKTPMNPAMVRPFEIAKKVARYHHTPAPELHDLTATGEIDVTSALYIELVHMVDQNDARTDRSRMRYQAGEWARLNPGVRHGEQATFVDKQTMWQDIYNGYFVHGYDPIAPTPFHADIVFAERFGTDLAKVPVHLAQ